MDTLFEELEALRAIYEPTNVAWRPAPGGKECLEGVVQIDCPEEFSDDPAPGLRIALEIPKGYPELRPKCVSLDAPLLANKPSLLRQVAATCVDAYFKSESPSIFDVIEGVREQVSQLGPKLVSKGASDDVFEGSIAGLPLTPAARPPPPSPPPRITSGEPLIDRKSVFQAHTSCVASLAEVRTVVAYLKALPKISRATHNIVAYRFERAGSAVVQDHDSDGESAAGGKLQQLLDILAVRNVVVVVTRWYGGTPLGPARFRHINNVARKVLVDAGFVKPNG